MAWEKVAWWPLDQRFIDMAESEAVTAENMRSVKHGCMVCVPFSDECLLSLGMIERNKVGWYDLTAAGRKRLADLEGCR